MNIQLKFADMRYLSVAISFSVKEYLRDTCLSAQDNYKLLLKYFRIE